MTQKGWPRRSGERGAAEIRNPNSSYRAPRLGQHALSWERRADEFIEYCREAEARLLAAGFRDPIGLNNEALEHGLTGGDFAFDEHSFVFAFACLTAEHSIEPTIGDLIRLAPRHGVPLWLDDVDRILFLPDFQSARLPTYTSEVIALSRRRQRARELYRDYRALLAPIPVLATQTIRPFSGLKGRVVA